MSGHTNTQNTHLILHPNNPLCVPYEVEIIGGNYDSSHYDSPHYDSSHYDSPRYDSLQLITKKLKKKKKRILKKPCKCKTDTSRLCIACTEKPKDYICLPCGHVCFCEECFKKFTNENTYKRNANDSEDYTYYNYNSISNYCPVCRDYISRIIKIYY